MRGRRRLGEPDLLVDHQLGRGAGVVDLGAVDVLGADAGALEGFRRQDGRAAAGRRGRGRCPSARRARIRGPTARAARRRLAEQDDRGGAVGDRRAHQEGQRVDDHPARQHLLDAQLAAVLGARIEAAVVLVLDDDCGEVLGARPGDAHVAPGHVGVEVHEEGALGARRPRWCPLRRPARPAARRRSRSRSPASRPSCPRGSASRRRGRGRNRGRRRRPPASRGAGRWPPRRRRSRR